MSRSSVRTTRLRTGMFALIGVAIVGISGFAFALWSGSDTSSKAVAIADSVNAGNTPVVIPAGSSVAVSWSASTLAGGASVSGYDVKRYDTGGTEQTVNAACAGMITALTCTETSVPDGSWQYTVTPRIGLWRGAVSPKSSAQTIGTTKLVITTPARSAIAGASTGTITIQRQDTGGNPTTVSGLVLNLASNRGTGTFRNAADTATITGITIPDGASSVDVRYRDTLAGTAQITASAPSAPTVTAAVQNVTITNAAADHLTFTQQPSDSSAGAVFATQPKVTVQDQYGNTVLGASNSITLSVATGPVGGSVSCTPNTVSASSGVASFAGCSIAKSGTYTLQAAASGFSSTTSASLVISTGSAARLAFVQQPTNALAGVAISPAVTLRVEDTFGNLVTSSSASITIAFGTNPGAGTLSGTTTQVASGGIATFNDLSVNKAAAGYTLSATSVSLTAATSNTFTISAAAPSRLTYDRQPTNTAAGGTITPSVRVRIEDAFGNPTTSSAQVTLAIGTNPGGGILSGTLTQTAVAGLATFPGLSIDKVGTGYTLTAASSGLTGDTSSLFNITAGAAAKLKFISQPSSAVAGATLGTITVQIQDAGGNLTTSSAAVTLAIGTNPGAGSLSGTLTQNAVGGVATFTGLSINKAGTGYTLTAASSGLTGDTSTTFNITAGTANKLTFSAQPTNTVAGVFIAPAVSVRIEDSLGNLTSSTAAVTVALTTPGGATLSGTTGPNAVAGIATFSDLSVNKIGTYTLTATSSGLTNGVSGSFTISAAAAATLTFSTQPTNVQAAVTFNPVVTVTDAFANPVSGRSVVLTVTGNPSVGFSCPTSTTTVASNASGTAAFVGCRINTAGTYTLTATSSPLTVQSSSFIVSAGPAAIVSFSVSPSSPTTAGLAFSTQPTVLVTDANLNPVSAAPVTLTVTGNPAVGFTCTSTSGTTNASGLLAFAGCKLTKSGTYTLTATSGSLTGASASFTINAAATAAISFTTQPSTTATAGLGFVTQPAVTAVDSFGNPVTGEPVTLSVTGNPVVGFSCTANPASTAATGVATFAGCKLTKSGTYTFTAAAGAFTATSNSFTINAAATATLSFTTQPSASTPANTPLTTQPAVTAVDSFGNAVSGAAVTLAVTGNPTVGFTCTTNPVTSDAAGIATFAGCKLTKAGSYTFTATAGAVTSPVSSTFTINPGTASTFQMSTCQINAGPVLTACPGPFSLPAVNDTLKFTVDTFDSFGNLVPVLSAIILTNSSNSSSNYTVSSPGSVAGGSSRSATITVQRVGSANNKQITVTAPGFANFLVNVGT